MIEVELFSWLFVHSEWDKLRRMPTPDKGFEDEFRDYIYRKVHFDVVSTKRDLGLGLSHRSLSETLHELDVVCSKDSELFVFELKHYEVSDLSKEIVFTFLGKLVDFYLGNVSVLSSYRINPLLVTIRRNVDDTVRKLCLTYGVKLIEPSLMTLGVMDYFARDLYLKIPRDDAEVLSTTERLVESIGKLKDDTDHTFSDIAKYAKDSGIISLDIQPLEKAKASTTLGKIKKCYTSFEEVREKWGKRSKED